MSSSISWDNTISNALGSAGAGTLSRLMTHPLDTMKARIQADGAHYQKIVHQGPLTALRKTYQQEGIRGWYRGLATVLIGGTPGTVLYLCSYDLIKNKIVMHTDSSESKFGIHFVSGLLAEAIACIIYVPVDVIKERLQVQQIQRNSKSRLTTTGSIPIGGYYSGGSDALIQIMQTEGWRGIYRGYGATLASFGPFSALYFVTYEHFKTLSEDIASTKSLPLPYLISSSAFAGAIASFLTSPLDMAKLRLQIHRSNPTLNDVQKGRQSVITSSHHHHHHHGMFDVLKQAYNQGGVKSLFRGAGARVLHFVPATTVTMTSYESMRQSFHKVLYESDTANP